MSDPIRVGLIRCDTHGAYYAPLLARHDALRLQRPVAPDAPQPYSWMAGGNHFYLYTKYNDPRAMTAPFVDGFTLVKLWDEQPAAAKALADLFENRPLVCDSFAQVSDGVDLVFIADCNGDGLDHLELAQPGLLKGVPTFIDKPLADTPEHARAILDLARRHHAPIFSASILRHLPGAAQFRDRLSEVGRADSGCVRGGGTHSTGQIHAVSLAQAVFGSGIRHVRAMGPENLGVMHLSWGNRADRPASGVVLHHAVKEQWHCSFHVSAYGSEGAILCHHNLNDWHFPAGAAEILRLLRDMVRTGRTPDALADMLEAVAVLHAGRLSQARGSDPVEVTQLLPQARA